MNSHEYLQYLHKQREILQTIQREADPASGISFMIRRGVACDNPKVEDDAERRPWAIIETANLETAREIISRLLDANLGSILRWRKIVRQEIAAATEVLQQSTGIALDPLEGK